MSGNHKGILEILTKGDPRLRKKCAEVNSIGREEKILLAQMMRTMYALKGLGLAAPQVGVLKRLLVIDAGEGHLRLVNPRIVKRRGADIKEEGCLSLPEIAVNVRRAKEVTAEAQDAHGRDIRVCLCGLAARVLQHEIDHLNGVLIIDYLPWYKRVIAGRRRA